MPRRSLPVRGAWIEIAWLRKRTCEPSSLPVRGAWIEIMVDSYTRIFETSLPVRGAWIEIRLLALRKQAGLSVAPRAGSVD